MYWDEIYRENRVEYKGNSEENKVDEGRKIKQNNEMKQNIN
jgi:hypothetical protein